MSINKQWIALPWLVAAACSSSNGNSTTVMLTSVTTATTTACPNGGVTISSGEDSNGDGVLESTEVTSTQNVCNGTTPAPTHASLVTTTMLSVGNSHCPEGGTEIDSGLDNGAGGGIADDGILQPGEITSTQYVCAGETTPSALVSTTVLSAGDSHCAGGGVEIDSGLDDGAGGGTAGDGTLQPGEITSTQYVCNGAGGAGSLVTTTQLPTGDVHCPNGGTQIDTGTDNGNNGGVADDGILQPGEITKTQYVCDGVGSYSQLYVGSMTPPASPAGAYTIDTSGGAASNGNGGSGGALTLEIHQGTLGGHAKIFSTGVVDASFETPAVDFNQGVIPFAVTQDTQLNSYPDQGSGIDSGDAVFQVTNDQTLYANVGGDALAVTSIEVDEGTTLTLANNSGGNNKVQVQVQRDIRNAGTITTGLMPDGVSATPLSLTMSNYIGTKTSAIALDGHDADGATAGSGGALQVNCNGTLVNAGNIHAGGGAGNTGGAGGSVSLTTNVGGGVFNSGAIDNHGGASAADVGGVSNFIYLSGDYGGQFNSGPLTATGGVGTSGGGYGGEIDLEGSDTGAVQNTGAISTSGGDCTTSGCNGGSGGVVRFQTQGGGALLNSGDIDTSGGAGSNTNGVGGTGGNIVAKNFDGSNAQNGNINLSTGSTRCSGSITARGGAGATGGAGGAIDFDLNVSNLALGQEIELRGYTDVTLNGGSASATGGTGGQFTIEQDTTANSPGNNQSNFGPAGAVINYANISTRGGDGLLGGQSGQVHLQTQRNVNFYDTFELAINGGTIDTTSGLTTADNSPNGAAPGEIQIQLLGIAGVQNSGSIIGDGGDASGANSEAGYANDVTFTSDTGTVLNTGTITLNGGAGSGISGSNGSGGNVNMYGVAVINTAAITCDGSSGSVTGGGGGSITLFSSSGGPTVNSGTLTVDGGIATDASNDGSSGSIQIDGVTEGS